MIAEKIEQLNHSLNSYGNANPTEIFTIQRIIKLLNETDRCFYRDCFKPGHITTSSWLLNSKHTHVLLTHHKKLNKWLQLGGHADGEEDTLKSAMREAREESGIIDFSPITGEIFDVDIHHIPARGEEPDHEHFDIRYAFVCNGNEVYLVSDESHDLKWVPIQEIETYTQEASMLRMACKWTHTPTVHP